MRVSERSVTTEKVEFIGVTYKGSEVYGLPAMSEGDCGRVARVGHPGGTR